MYTETASVRVEGFGFPLEDVLLARPDWAVLGLVLAVVGAFLIANATLFEHPRRLVARYFGRKTGRLQSVREYVYNRVQTTLGFGFLMAGFGLQLVGHFQAAAPGEAPFSMAWVGLVVLVVVGLLFGGWWWSLIAFRRYVREYFNQAPRDLESEPGTARELGELFGIEPGRDDTVEAYVGKLHREAGLRRPGEMPMDDSEPELIFETVSDSIADDPD
ncbi:MAG TPA: hypothetical protein EYQ74_14570 [Planctomycetes bacterium]|nr:hypothetical protein [Planctomycetota bacterium]HIK61081.1 hypothetical protein [Planctomycetota bacterium]